MVRKPSFLIAVALLVLSIGYSAAQLDKILKGGGIAVVVSKFGPEINKALNDLTNTRGETSTYSTKVVPIISGGNGNQVGACQIMGPAAAVKKVQAVAQLEGKFGPLGIRLRALIPIASKSITDITRVPGVGISGLIDVKL